EIREIDIFGREKFEASNYAAAFALRTIAGNSFAIIGRSGLAQFSHDIAAKAALRMHLPYVSLRSSFRGAYCLMKELRRPSLQTKRKEYIRSFYDYSGDRIKSAIEMIYKRRIDPMKFDREEIPYEIGKF
ncbi:MAG: hypothetical protein AABY10_00430, partial [Nanoarchaeota archaeon]